MELLKILNDFEELIDQNPKIPLTGKIVIAEETVLSFVDKIRTSLPEEVKQANWVTKEHRRIIEEAKQEAEKIIQEAHHHVTKVADESEVVKQAQMQADEITKRSNEVAKEIHMGANQYANDILKQLEKNLEKTMGTVKEGRKELEESINPGDSKYQE